MAQWFDPRRAPRLGALLLAGSLPLACADGEVPVGDPVAAGTNVEVTVRIRGAKATLGHAKTSVSATGTVRPWRSANLRAEVGGRVDRILVDDGAEVKSGATLVKIDGSRQSIAVAASGASEAGAAEEVERAEEHLTRMRTLRAEKTVSRVQVEQAEHDLERAKAGLRGAKAEVRNARRQQRDTIVKAPIPGIVAGRLVDQGDTIGPGAPLLDLVDLSRIRITVGVTGRDLARLAQDKTPSVRINDLGGVEVEDVTIGALAPTSNPATGLFDVELRAPNPDGKVRGGMIAAVDLPLVAGKEQVLVPREAITRRDGRLAVFEIVEGRAMLRPVETGSYDAANIEIVEGLAAGAIVATSGLHTLAEGVSVELTGAAASELVEDEDNAS